MQIERVVEGERNVCVLLVDLEDLESKSRKEGEWVSRFSAP
jgi:hypothetical protein